MPTNTLLPESFAGLEPFCEKWIKETEKERNEVRIHSTLQEIRVFYNAVLPRFEEILKHLDSFEVDALPPPEENLLKLVFSFVEASCAVERFDSPIVTPTFPPERFVIHEDMPVTSW